MSFLKPTIKSLRPSNLIVLRTVGGSPQGYSDQLELEVEVRASTDASSSINGIAVLIIINAAQYRFADNSSELRIPVLQNEQVERISLQLRIKNIHALATKPAPLLLTVCTFDVATGEDFKLCHSGQFPVSRSGPAIRLKAFK